MAAASERKTKTELIDQGEMVCEKALKAGAKQAEAFVLDYDYLILRFAGSELLEAKSDSVFGTRLRVLLDDGKLGSTSVTDLSSKSIDHMIADALSIAKSSPPGHYKSFPNPKSETSEQDFTYQSVIEQLRNPEKPIEMVNAQIETSLDASKMIDNVSGSHSLYHEAYAIVSSQGVRKAAEGTKMSVALTTHLEGPGGSEPISGYSWYDSRDATNFDPDELSNESTEMALASANPKKLSPEKYDVLWNPYTWAEFMSYILGFAVSCRYVQDGYSYFVDKIGEDVANSNLSIIDDPHNPLGMFSASFDDEGTPTSRLPIIENGVLRNYLADTYFATRDLSVAEPNGHAYRRADYIHELVDPEPMPSNIEFAGKDTKSQDELIGDIKDGLMVSRIWYTYPINPTRGDFTGNLRAGMFRIIDGEVAYPIRQARFMDNLPVMLKNIDGIGNNEKQVNPWFGVNVTAPSILARNVRFVQ